MEKQIKQKAKKKKPAKKPADKPRQKAGGQALESFKNRAKAWQYLSEAGYKISRKTFYNHVDAGIIKPDEGKKGFSLKKLKEYAVSELDKVNTLEKKKAEEGFKEERNERILKTKEERKLLELRRLREEGQVIERALVYQQFAALTVSLENAAKGQAMIDAEDAAEMIENADNKPARFVEIFNDIIDRALNEIAKMNNLEVVFGEEG